MGVLNEQTLDPVKEIKHRHKHPTPRGRDVRKMPKPYTCREVIFTCSNGWRIEKLVRADYALEGFFMGHCLGGKDAAGSIAGFSLREPDGTPHVTIITERGGLHGRCNAYPKAKYVELCNEWFRASGKAEQPLERPGNHWGTDDDEAYHEQHVLDDRDYRDLPGGKWWRDEDWYAKRGKE